MNNEPILWSDNYQLSSEHVILEIKNNAIDKMISCKMHLSFLKTAWIYTTKLKAEI